MCVANFITYVFDLVGIRIRSGLSMWTLQLAFRGSDSVVLALVWSGYLGFELRLAIKEGFGDHQS